MLRGFDTPPRQVAAPSGGLAGFAAVLCAAVMRQRRLLLLMLGLLVAYAVMTHGRQADQADPDWTSTRWHDRVRCTCGHSCSKASIPLYPVNGPAAVRNMMPLTAGIVGTLCDATSCLRSSRLLSQSCCSLSGSNRVPMGGRPQPATWQWQGWHGLELEICNETAMLGRCRMCGCSTRTMGRVTHLAWRTRTCWRAPMRSSDRTGKTSLHAGDDNSPT